MKTIAVFGAFGIPNVGDDAILQANLELIEYKYGRNCKVYIFTKDASYTSMHLNTNLHIIPISYVHEVTRQEWYNPEKIEEKLEQIQSGKDKSIGTEILHKIFKEIDLFHIAGGGYLNSKWKDIISELYELVAFAKKYNKPYILTGISLTLDDIDLTKIADIFNDAKLIDFRDDTYKTLKNINNYPIYQTCDDALLLSYDSLHNNLKDSKYVNILLHDWVNYTDSIKNVLGDTIIPFIQDLVETKQIECVNILGFSNGDIELWEDIALPKSIQDNSNIINCTLLDSGTIKSIVADAQFNISSRFHMAVFSLSSGIPIYSIIYDNYYNNKIHSIHNLYNSQNCISIDSVTIEGLYNFAKQIDEYRQELYNEMEKVQSIYDSKIERIYNVYEALGTNAYDGVPKSIVSKNISVIMPIFNMGLYLREALDSVINQTLKNIELICINDGSTDNSIDILNEYASKYDYIKIINKENAGVAAARNDGINAANGEFLFFLDPDDWLPDNDVLKDLFEAAKLNHVSICGGNFVEHASGYINTNWTGVNSKYTFTKSGIKYYKDYQFDYGWVRFIYKRNLLIDNSIYIPKVTFFEDPQFFVRIMSVADKFYILNRPTYCYRSGHHSYALSYTKVVDLIKSMTVIVNIANEYGYTDLIKLEEYRLCHDYSVEIVKYLKFKENHELKTALRELNKSLYGGDNSIEYGIYEVIIGRKDYDILVLSTTKLISKDKIKSYTKRVLKKILPKSVINILKNIRRK